MTRHQRKTSLFRFPQQPPCPDLGPWKDKNPPVFIDLKMVKLAPLLLPPLRL